MAEDKFRTHVSRAVRGSGSVSSDGMQAFMGALRQTAGVFTYLNAQDVVTRLDATSAAILAQLRLIEENTPDATGLAAHWNEFYPHYFQQVSQFARDWGARMVQLAREEYEANPNAPNRDAVLDELKKIENSIPGWKYAFED